MLAAVDGLGEEDLTRAVAPSGWSMAQLLNHLAYDDEIFWGCAIVGGDEEAYTRQCILRLLVETATHAGHLDMAREAIDGHQHLVVS